MRPVDRRASVCVCVRVCVCVSVCVCARPRLCGILGGTACRGECAWRPRIELGSFGATSGYIRNPSNGDVKGAEKERERERDRA